MRIPFLAACVSALSLAACTATPPPPPVSSAPLAAARQEIMWTLRIVYRMTMPRIAGILNRDHTTVLHGVRVHQKRADGTQPTAKNTGKPICIETVRSLQSEGRSMRWIAEHLNVGFRRLSATIARAA